ncbi:MAG: hypothetical protein R3A48_14200 [Polyangiales bacterium]
MTKNQSRRLAMLAACSAILGAVVSAGGAAEAQVVVQGQAGISVGATGYAQPPPVYQQPQVVYQQQPQVVYQQQPVVYQQQQLVLARPSARRGNVGRFRYGIDGGAGWQFMDYTSGFNLSASMRLGWQLNDQIAIYYQTDLPIGFVSGRSPGGTDVAGASIIWGNAAMFEYTLNDIVSFGIGPSADIGIGSVCGGSSSSTCVGAAGTFFGIQSRIAFNLMPSAEQSPYRRAGFRVGLGGHTTFMGGTVVQSLTILLGWELM